MIASESKHILIVDDHPENLTALEAILQDPHLVLERANSGEEALRQVLRKDYALILMDVKMPRLDGFQTAELIRQRERSQRTPIIFLTAHDSPEEQIFRGYRSGAVDYMSKPVIPEILRSKVAVFVDLFEKTQQLRRMNETLEEQVAQRTQELQLAEERYRSIFFNAMEGIFQISPDGRFVMANPSMALKVGYDSPEHLIAEVKDIRTQIFADPADYDSLVERLQREGRIRGEEYRVRRRDGRLIWVLMAARLRDEESNGGFEGLMRDITDRKKIQASTEAKSRDLQTLLYVISHDVKEPVREILGYATMFEDEVAPRLPQEDLTFIRRMTTSAKRLDQLLDDVRMLIQAQQMKDDLQPAEGEMIVRRALSHLEKRIEDTHARITVEDNLPVLWVNERWAIHAILNLVGNALKFVREGQTPEVEIGAAPPEKTKAGWGLVVRDRGPGVPEQHRERIFQLFKRAAGRNIEGTGAGLAIVAQIAHGHGGRVWVEPREGGGSEFYITFGYSRQKIDSGETKISSGEVKVGS